MLPVHGFGDSIHSGRLRSVERREAGAQVVHREVVHQRGIARLRGLARPCGYPLDSRRRRASTSVCGRRCRRAGSLLCPPLLRGRYPTSTLIWGHPTSSGSWGFLPVCRLCHPTPIRGRAQRISRVPGAALVTCHGLRPRWIRRSHGQLGSFDMAFREQKHVGIHSFVSMTGLNPFTLAHCGPSPPCVRFAASVTDGDATLGTRCLAKASGARFCPWLATPSFARRTLFGIRATGYHSNNRPEKFTYLDGPGRLLSL